MKTILAALFTLSLLATGIMGQTPESAPASQQGRLTDPSKWSKYGVDSDEFSVALPTRPAMTTSKILQKQTGKERLQRHLKTGVDGVLYSVYVVENPKPRQSLEEFIAEQSADAAYDPATERNVVVDGVPGKEYSSGNNTSPVMVQFFATEKRLYKFTTIGAGDAAGVKQFFATIRLGKKADGYEVHDGPGVPLVLDTGERLFKATEVDTKARLRSKPEPSYPQKALQERISGTVVLRAVFSKTGRVENIIVLSGPAMLIETAIEAAKQIKFTPAMKDGQPVSMWMQLEYNFNL